MVRAGTLAGGRCFWYVFAAPNARVLACHSSAQCPSAVACKVTICLVVYMTLCADMVGGFRIDSGEDSERMEVAFAALRQLESNRLFGSRLLKSVDSTAACPSRSNFTLSQTPLKQGGFLHAHPLQCSSAFWRTVLLVCSYATGDSAMALVVNRPTGRRLGDVISSAQMQSHTFLQHFKQHSLFYGGPVKFILFDGHW